MKNVFRTHEIWATNLTSTFERLEGEDEPFIDVDEEPETVLEDEEMEKPALNIDRTIVAPKFIFDTERSDTGIPKVSILFPNGQRDNLILSNFDTNEGNRLEDVKSCRYVGHLEFEPEACVAMTGCFEKDNVEFTILSKHAEGSGSYQLNLNGSVMVHAPDMSLIQIVCPNYIIHFNET